MAKKTALTITIQQEGVRETLAAFRGLPKEASNEIRDTSKRLAGLLATAAQAAGRQEGHQASLVASTVKAARDRVPVVQAGGTTRLGSRKAPAWKLLFGSEFGSNDYRQFPSMHRGNVGIWFFPTVEDRASEIAAEWRQAAERIVRAFASKGA